MHDWGKKVQFQREQNRRTSRTSLMPRLGRVFRLV